LQAYQNNFSIITGGPGVGKTTSIKKLLTILLKVNPELKVALCAPTGKAAQRMKESLLFNPEIEQLPPAEIIEKIDAIKSKASTIHLLLKSLSYKDNSPYFTYNKSNPLDMDIVIVDESSMIDVALFSKLLEAIPPTSRVIFLGDKDQLASVEAASIFGDICSSTQLNEYDSDNVIFLNEFLEGCQQLGASHISSKTHLLKGKMIQLTHSHRFNSNDGIGVLSKAIINEDQDTVKSFVLNKDSQVKIDNQYNEELYTSLIDNYNEYITILLNNSLPFDEKIKSAIDSFNQFRILTAIREGSQGIYAINKKVENKLTHYFPGIFRTDLEFYEFRPVMVTKNNYNVTPNLFNGDTGIIAKDENGQLKAWFDKEGSIKPYACGFLGKVETNFAQTIHKSQGSEYPIVLVVMPKNNDILILTKELLYTGVTRAKHHVTIMSSEDILSSTVSRKVLRVSGIVSQLNN
jgi:exodeoxyribonuclease V alpha subunit